MGSLNTLLGTDGSSIMWKEEDKDAYLQLTVFVEVSMVYFLLWMLLLGVLDIHGVCTVHELEQMWEILDYGKLVKEINWCSSIPQFGILVYVQGHSRHLRNDNDSKLDIKLRNVTFKRHWWEAKAIVKIHKDSATMVINDIVISDGDVKDGFAHGDVQDKKHRQAIAAAGLLGQAHTLIDSRTLRTSMLLGPNESKKFDE
ncbi:hypothetical protein Tco_1012085, partial [Tanacetum coccineum]